MKVNKPKKSWLIRQCSFFVYSYNFQCYRGRLATVFSCVYVSVLRFLCFFFFFFFFLLPAYVDFGAQKSLFCTVAVLFMYGSNTVHELKNIKNRSHGTFHKFKNYFATVFSVFSFQFSVSATISSIQTDP